MVAWHSPQHHLRDIWSNGYSRRRRRVRASIRMRRAGDCGLLTTHHWARVACGAATVARLACWNAPGTGGLHAAPEALSLVPTLSFRPEPILQDTRLASSGQPCTRRTWMLFFCNALHGVSFG